MNLGNPERPVGGLAVPRPTGVEIRPLGRDDFADAIALARELYVLDADVPLEPVRPGYDALVNDPDATPFLALADGEAAGLIVQRFRRRLNHATFEGWISDLVVRERYRGRGIGRALLASAIAEWRLRGGHQMMLEVSYDRTAARALYESAGFENQGKYFEIGPVKSREHLRRCRRGSTDHPGRRRFRGDHPAAGRARTARAGGRQASCAAAHL